MKILFLQIQTKYSEWHQQKHDKNKENNEHFKKAFLIANTPAKSAIFWKLLLEMKIKINLKNNFFLGDSLYLLKRLFECSNSSKQSTGTVEVLYRLSIALVS